MADNLHTDNHGDMRHCVSMETTPPAMPDLHDGNDTGGDAKSLRPWKYILPTAETMLHIHG